MFVENVNLSFFWWTFWMFWNGLLQNIAQQTVRSMLLIVKLWTTIVSRSFRASFACSRPSLKTPLITEPDLPTQSNANRSRNESRFLFVWMSTFNGKGIRIFFHKFQYTVCFNTHHTDQTFPEILSPIIMWITLSVNVAWHVRFLLHTQLALLDLLSTIMGFRFGVSLLCCTRKKSRFPSLEMFSLRFVLKRHGKMRIFFQVRLRNLRMTYFVYVNAFECLSSFLFCSLSLELNLDDFWEFNVIFRTFPRWKKPANHLIILSLSSFKLVHRKQYKIEFIRSTHKSSSRLIHSRIIDNRVPVHLRKFTALVNGKLESWKNCPPSFSMRGVDKWMIFVHLAQKKTTALTLIVSPGGGEC